MTSLRNLLDINYELVLFASGLVFFIVGLAISLQSRRKSRLQLARSLRWFALFGIAFGLHEWGLLFVPIQALYMNYLAISTLQLLQLMLLGVAFFALFAFGADLLQDKWPRLKVIPYIIFLIWMIWVLILKISSGLGVGLLQQQAMILAKYLIAFPGALLAAYGLLYQARRQIKPLKLQAIYNTMVVASITLVLFAFIGGLFVPYAGFFPANVINQSLLIELTGVPVQVYLSIIGLALAVAVIRVLEVFDLETGRLIEKMQVEQNMAAERERIGREIHDGAIQTLYTAGLIVESTRRRVDGDPVLTKRLDRVMTALNETVISLRANMNDLRAGSQVSSLVEGLQKQAQDPRFTSLMEVELVIDLPETAVFNPAQSTHVLAIAGEAMTNAARHAGPNCVRIAAVSRNGHFVLDISDDGDGFPARQSNERGYGMRNMRDRARLLGGELIIDSKPGKGSSVILTVPWEAL
ncbi:MAG TPA: ATP-binding protein [candidate division Zixibacteria bacterium]|nr:ATP-binding protein [candidate division Zixibacteria bacterium]